MHLVEPFPLARELGRAQRTARVDDHIALPHLQPDRRRHGPEVLADSLRALATEIHVSWNAFGRRFRVQLEGQPCDLDRTFALELLDSDRVDVAPGSNVVREDD